MKSRNEKKDKLTGGNVSNVYRLGDTVRREIKENSSHIHKLLLHLEEKGFSRAPKFYGIDDQNREVLSFIEGEAGNYPLKPYMLSDDVLKEIARMQRNYHDAVSDFPIPDTWKSMEHTPGEIEVICHNDFAIYNIIFREQKPVGIIDFDVAAPGPRLWDIAYTLYTCVPLSRIQVNNTGDAVYYDQDTDADRIKQRVNLFFNSYGMSGMKQGFLEMVLLRIEGLCKYMMKKASEGDIAFQRMIEEGHLEHYQKELQFIRKHGKEWV